MKYIVWFSCLLLFSCKTDDDVKLANKWTLDSYIKNSVSTVTNVPFPLYFTFKKDNVVQVNLNVNICEGLYEKASETIILNNFNCTKLCCDSSAYIEAYELFIDSVKTYHINGKTLKLKGDHGTVMQFSLVE